MSSHQWHAVYRLIQRAHRRLPRPQRKPLYNDALIVAMYFWAVLHDRPQCWACDRQRGEPEGDLQLLDSRPLPVGACSKDKQARPGRVYGGFARGYRLHACMSEDGRFLAWKVTAMNVS